MTKYLLAIQHEKMRAKLM